MCVQWRALMLRFSGLLDLSLQPRLQTLYLQLTGRHWDMPALSNKMR